MADTFTLDPSRVVRELQAQAPSAAKRVADAIRPHAPVGKDRPDGHEGGGLRDGLAGKATNTPNGAELAVTSDKDYVRYVIEGTKPHQIQVRTARALRFWVEGDTLVFARHVNHPGTQPNLFYREAEDDIHTIVQGVVHQAMRKVLRP